MMTKAYYFVVVVTALMLMLLLLTVVTTVAAETGDEEGLLHAELLNQLESHASGSFNEEGDDEATQIVMTFVNEFPDRVSTICM